MYQNLNFTCTHNSNYSHLFLQFAHGEHNLRRRSKSEVCPYWLKGICKFGSLCQVALTRFCNWSHFALYTLEYSFTSKTSPKISLISFQISIYNYPRLPILIKSIHRTKTYRSTQYGVKQSLAIRLSNLGKNGISTSLNSPTLPRRTTRSYSFLLFYLYFVGSS